MLMQSVRRMPIVSFQVISLTIRPPTPLYFAFHYELYWLQIYRYSHVWFTLCPGRQIFESYYASFVFCYFIKTKQRQIMLLIVYIYRNLFGFLSRFYLSRSYQSLGEVSSIFDHVKFGHSNLFVHLTNHFGASSWGGEFNCLFCNVGFDYSAFQYCSYFFHCISAYGLESGEK